MKKICVFCGTSSLDEELGPFYEMSGRYFHSNCLVFSSDIRQSSDKTIGLYGFHTKNIQTALNNGQQRICAFCSKKGATIKCAGGENSPCDISFHLPCALRSQTTVHVYFRKFDTYCSEHNPFECIFDCEPVTGINFVVDCCKRIYSHEDCLKEYVMDAKALSKCPLCLNEENFKDFIEVTHEIEIPDELPPYAESEDSEHYLKCAAGICKCPRGRFYHEYDTEFELVPCTNCGSDGIHRVCGQIQETDNWICKSCDPKSGLNVKSNGGKKKRKRAVNILIRIRKWFLRMMCVR